LVEDALKELPQDLPHTYGRILERIEAQSPYMRDLALNCLAWMIYAQRPLNTEELQIALATNSSYSNGLDLELDPPGVILEACGNLLEEAHDTIRPIHYTVQEFLGKTAQGLSHNSISQQLSDSASMHTQLSLVCLRYIRLGAFPRPAQDADDLEERLEVNMFASYAYQNFDHHIAQSDEISDEAMQQLENLFQHESQYLAAVLQIKALRDGADWETILQRFNPISFPVSASTFIYGSRLYNMPRLRQRWANDTPPTYGLHLACSAGLSDAVIRLLDAGCDTNEKDGQGVTPLYYASSEAHFVIVQRLLDKGADINAQGGYYGNALQAASAGGHEKIVMLLLDKGADINAQGGEYGNALQAASARGYEKIVMLLLDKGADINAQGGVYGNALQAASAGGDEKIVMLLLDKGAAINAQGGHYDNALQAASAGGHEKTVMLLLDKGVDIHTQGGYYGNALQAASAGGYEKIVMLLLDKGADIHAQGGYYGNALQAASAGGYEKIVMLLLDKGADINAQGGVYGNALQAASARGHEQVVKLMLDKGASVKAGGEVSE
jgi:ankyrin repeat protein